MTTIDDELERLRLLKKEQQERKRKEDEIARLRDSTGDYPLARRTLNWLIRKFW